MSDKPAWQYRCRDEGTLHGPYDDEKILSWFGRPQSTQETKDLEVRIAQRKMGSLQPSWPVQEKPRTREHSISDYVALNVCCACVTGLLGTIGFCSVRVSIEPSHGRCELACHTCHQALFACDVFEMLVYLLMMPVLQFRNIMDADIAWMPLTDVLARFKTDLCAVDSDVSSQDDAASALTSRCGSGSFTPPTSDEQAGSSLIPTPRDNDSFSLTAPPSPEHRDSKSISTEDAYNVTLGRVADKVAYRNEGRPGSQHHKTLQKNFVCWCILPQPGGQPDFPWVRNLLLLCDSLLKFSSSHCCMRTQTHRSETSQHKEAV